MSKNYIDKKRFEELIVLYLEDRETYEDELVETFDLLISNILASFRFNVDDEDAKQECFALILKILKNFKQKKGTAFNYFTTVIVNNLKYLYTKDKRYQVKLDAYMQKEIDKYNDFN